MRNNLVYCRARLGKRVEYGTRNCEESLLTPISRIQSPTASLEREGRGSATAFEATTCVSGTRMFRANKMGLSSTQKTLINAPHKPLKKKEIDKPKPQTSKHPDSQTKP